MADGLEAFYLYVLGSIAELLGAEAHGQTDGVIASEERAVEHDGLRLVLENLQVQRSGAGIDVLSLGLCEGVGADGCCSHQKKGKMLHNTLFLLVILPQYYDFFREPPSFGVFFSVI